MIKYSRYIPPDDATMNRPSDYTSSDDPYDGQFDTYFAHDKDGKALAMARVSHYKTRDFTSEHLYDPDTNEETPVVEAQRAHITEPDENDPWREAITRPAESGEQLVMFGHHHVPASTVVHELYARNNMAGKTSAMTLLGMADIASTTTTGSHLKPSSDLSSHSKSLVDKLNKSGAISDEDMPPEGYGNAIGFSYGENKLNQYPRSQQLAYQNLNSRIPHARARIRGVLGKPTRELGPQFTQMQLEGFE